MIEHRANIAIVGLFFIAIFAIITGFWFWLYKELDKDNKIEQQKIMSYSCPDGMGVIKLQGQGNKYFCLIVAKKKD